MFNVMLHAMFIEQSKWRACNFNQHVLVTLLEMRIKGNTTKWLLAHIFTMMLHFEPNHSGTVLQ